MAGGLSIITPQLSAPVAEWHTRQVEGLCPLGVEVRVLSGAKLNPLSQSGFFVCAA